MAEQAGALARENAIVGWLWRLAAVLLAGAFLFWATETEDGRSFAFRYDTQLLDAWQRMSGEDEPSGEVIVVGVDADTIQSKGRWPWPRAQLAELIEKIANAGPKSLAIDFLLTEPGPLSDVNLLRIFGQNGGKVIELRGADPQQLVAEALSKVPTALAVAGGTRDNFDLVRFGSQQVACIDPDLQQEGRAKLYYAECLFYPLDPFYNVTREAVTQADKDIDGVVRRASALVAQPYRDENGRILEFFLPAFPLAALIRCADVNPTCPSLAISPADLSAQNVDIWRNFELRLTRAEGGPLPPLALTRAFNFWMDFGALRALDAPRDGREAGPDSTVSALAVLLEDEAELARLKGKHVALGLTRLGDVDQHATPLATEAGTPGVVIQALAADNILTGRALAQPVWTVFVGELFAGFMVLLALLRFLTPSLYGLIAIIGVGALGPVAASWAAFEFGQTVVYAATPTVTVALAGGPIFFGRIFAVIRSWLSDRDEKNKQTARLDILNRMQSGSLPFDADFTDRGVETAAICRPSKEVGGDFFELMELGDGRILGAVGDVMGKDVNAGLVSVISKTISGTVTSRAKGPLGEVFEEISAEFLRLAPDDWLHNEGGFVTLVATRLDPETGEAEFAAAGADTPIVVSKTGEIRALDLPSVAPFGWLEAPRFVTGAMRLEPGDSVVMFTDGVTEAPAPMDAEAPPDGDLEFGYERARRAAAEAAAGGAQAVIARLDEAIKAHLAGGDPIDDTTILVMTWTGPPA